MSLVESLQAYAAEHNEQVELSRDRVDRHAMLDQRAEAERQTAEQKVLLRQYQKAIACGDRAGAVKIAAKLPSFLNDAGMRVSPVERVAKDLDLYPRYTDHLESCRERFAASRTVRAMGKLLLDFRQQMDQLIAEGDAASRTTRYTGLEQFCPLGFDVARDTQELLLADHEAMEAEREKLLSAYPWLRPIELKTAEDVEDRPRGKRSK